MSLIRDHPFGTYTSTLISPSHETEQQKLFTTARFFFSRLILIYDKILVISRGLFLVCKFVETNLQT